MFQVSLRSITASGSVAGRLAMGIATKLDCPPPSFQSSDGRVLLTGLLICGSTPYLRSTKHEMCFTRCVLGRSQFSNLCWVRKRVRSWVHCQLGRGYSAAGDDRNHSRPIKPTTKNMDKKTQEGTRRGIPRREVIGITRGRPNLQQK